MTQPAGDRNREHPTAHTPGPTAPPPPSSPSPPPEASDPSTPPPAPSDQPHDPVRGPWQPAMRQALSEATRATETGDVPVGAIVLGPDGAVLGRGRNEREATGDPTAHAETIAIREAAHAVGAWRLSGCTLVVTLEPCTMCAGATVLARLDRVVYGAHDPKAGAAGSLWDVIRDRRLNHRPEVIPGVLPDECGTLLTRFFRTATPNPDTPTEQPGHPTETGPDTDFGHRRSVG